MPHSLNDMMSVCEQPALDRGMHTCILHNWHFVCPSPVDAVSLPIIAADLACISDKGDAKRDIIFLIILKQGCSHAAAPASSVIQFCITE